MVDEERSGSVPAGWYPHNSRAGVERYWDGRSWTEQTRKGAKKKPRRGEAKVLRPGWYPHPTLTARERYWDGVQWTGHSRGKDEARKAAVAQREADRAAVAAEDPHAKIVCQFCQHARHPARG